MHTSACVGSAGDSSVVSDRALPPPDDVECVVIGAGVVGLAVARALALRGREVLVLDAAGAIGTETSSRHSEVIHAGIYYPAGSLKARLCVEGKAMLYDYCAARAIPHKRITKLIVATAPEQLPALRALREAARRNGVPDLQELSGAEASSLEPALACHSALLSPSTGILDSHRYMEALLADAEAAGATLALRARVVGGRVTDGKASSSSGSGRMAKLPAADKVLHVASAPDGALSRLRARWVVNAAGLHAQRVAALVGGMPRGAIPQQHLAKGNYFSLSLRPPFSRLIYPMPEQGLGGLGTHLTLDMAGAAKFGPDVEWLPVPPALPQPQPAGDGGSGLAAAAAVDGDADALGRYLRGLDYTVSPARSAPFYAAIRRYWPGLQDGALQPAYSGIRPKLSGPGQPAADFCLQGAAAPGVRGWVNLFGIESPGLTSSLAIAERVVRLLDGLHET